MCDTAIGIDPNDAIILKRLLRKLLLKKCSYKARLI